MNNADLKSLSGTKCRIFGLGRSNEALISYLARQGAEISVSDKRKSENEITDVLQKNGIKNANILPYNLPRKSDFVFRTPYIRPDATEITDNLLLGARLSSEVELFFANAKGKIYGITGSDGKTTTTSITYELLKQINPGNTFIGGNIGTPLVSFLDKLNDNSVTVCELSSFQLMTLDRAPHYSAITNITQNHLDWHTNIAEYIASKLKIFGTNTQKSVFPKNFPYIDLTPVNKKDTTLFSLDKNVDFIGLIDKYITFKSEKLLDIRKIKLIGDYNILNYMCAIGLTYPFVSKDDINLVANSFCGVSHRCEFVAEKSGVKFYDSSIDSTPSRTVATLSNFPDKSVILILGGYDKNLDYNFLAKYSHKKVLKYVLVGANKWKIYNALITNGIPLDSITVCIDFCDAIYSAFRLALGKNYVLLSPASASFDMFIDYVERGNSFKNIIKSV